MVDFKMPEFATAYNLHRHACSIIGVDCHADKAYTVNSILEGSGTIGTGMFSYPALPDCLRCHWILTVYMMLTL